MFAEALSKNLLQPQRPGFVERLLKRAKQPHIFGITRQTVQEFLRSEQALTLHNLSLCQFIRNYTYVAKIDAQWQADLADIQSIARRTC